jgi:hypothetical protein
LNDVVELKVPLTELIDQDVSSITIAVIYADGETAFEVKTWQKSNPTDLAQINAHNAGTTPLTFYFTNNEVGPALSTAYKVKPFDSVPLVSETLDTFRYVVRGRSCKPN